LNAVGEGHTRSMYGLLWLIAAILVIAGIVTVLRGEILAGIALIILGCLVGPGGVSIFT
jgi:NADH:ubiquinone oxidoreductase subunit 6 (subunit J)